MLVLAAVVTLSIVVTGQDTKIKTFNITAVDLFVSQLQYPWNQASECIFLDDVLTCVENYPYYNVTSVWRNSPEAIKYVSVNCLTRGVYRKSSCVCKDNTSNPGNSLPEDRYRPCQLTYLNESMLRYLPNLEVLDLSHNTIQTVTSRALIGLTKLKYLSLSWNNIKTIPFGFLCLAPSLQFLGLQNLPLDSFPLKKCKDNFTSLEVVDMRSSNINDLPQDAFDNLPELKSLDLSFNGLTKIEKAALSGARALEFLDLDNCHINSIFPHFCDYLPNITRIYLHSNAFTTFDFTAFEGCVALTHIDLSANAIVNMAGNVSKLESLQALNLDHNSLTSLDVISNGPESLSSLLLSNNNFQTIPNNQFSGLVNLTTLDISANRISTSDGFPQLFNSLEKLQFLNLSYNKIDRIVNNSFTGLKSLTQLLLGYNSLVNLEPMSFNGLNRLESLMIENNKLQSLPDDVFLPFKPGNRPDNQFQRLSLSNNRLTDLGNVKWWPPVKKLEIINNSLTSFPSAVNLSKMEVLDISRNNIQKFLGKNENIFADFETMKTINISYNAIGDLDMDKLQTMTNLEVFDMENNEIDISITNTTFRGLLKLSSLNLAKNKIQSVDSPFSANSLPGLIVLNMSANLLEHLGKLSRNFNDSLVQTVDFSKCHISHIDSDTFTGLKNLKVVKLEGNQIETFPQFHANLDTTFQLLNNPLVCACNMTWLLDKIVNLPDGTNISVQNFQMKKCKVYTEDLLYFPYDLQRSQFLCPEQQKCDSKCACFKHEQDGDVKLVKCQNNLYSVPEVISSTALSIFLDGNTFSSDDALSAFLNFGIMETKELYLNKSFISVVNSSHFKSYEYLEILNLADNLLKTLPSNVFKLQGMLKQLYLTNNLLSSIEPRVFDSLYNLQELDLSSNRLVALSTTTVTELQNLDYPKYFFLAGNRWACDCSNIQFKEFVDDVRFKIRDRNSLVCGTDSSREIQNLPRSDFLCSNQIESGSQTKSVIIVIIVVVCIVMLLLATFFYFRRELLSLFYYYTGCHIPSAPHLPSAHFDAYLTFDPSDHNCASYVHTVLMPKLKNNSYNIQTSYDIIEDLEVTQKVIEDSRSSIFIVDKNFSSNQFLVSVYMCAIKRQKVEKRHNVILIIHGDIVLADQEPEIQSRLRKGDYITARSRLWWPRLVYELPESNSGSRHVPNSIEEDTIIFSSLAEDQDQDDKEEI